MTTNFLTISLREKPKGSHIMKFSCSKNILLNLLTTASRAATGKSSMPLLEGLLINAEKNTLTITGYDLSMGIRTTDEANIEVPGKIVLNSRLFLDIVRKLPQDTVFVETNEQLLTTIKCGKAIFNLLATEADEYPALSEVSENNGFSLPQNLLKKMIAQTIFSISDNTAKPILTGCLFELTGDNLFIVAVDGYRLSVRKETTEGITDNIKFVVPGSSLREIEHILTDEDGTVDIFPDEKNILFRMGNTTLITRLIEGEFLNYNTSIPKKFAFEISVDRQEFITCIERVSLIINEKLKTPVRISFLKSYAQLSCITAIGKSYDECTFEGNANEINIGFNNRYLLEALKAAEGEKVILKFGGPLNPVVMVPPEGDKYTYLVLPVRLKEA